MYELYDRQKDDVVGRYRTIAALKKDVRKHFYDPYAPESMAYADDELVVYKVAANGKATVKSGIDFWSKKKSIKKKTRR